VVLLDRSVGFLLWIGHPDSVPQACDAAKLVVTLTPQALVQRCPKTLDKKLYTLTSPPKRPRDH